jgi:hypothetical protein
LKSGTPGPDRGWPSLDELGDRPVVEEMVKPGPLLAAELRPPRTGLSYSDGVDEWIDLHHAIGRMVRQGVPVLLTDNAVGSREEENLSHLAANLGVGEPLSLVVPFLTTKHELPYCLHYADRAHRLGFRGVTVVGGDCHVGPPRCVPHAFELREALRARETPLQLGGWANPHRSAQEQAEFIADPRFSADFVLTQIVSHHSLDQVRTFLHALEQHGVEVHPVFGVFYYRSAQPRTLARLGEYFPVPGEGISADFDEGLSPEEICARSVQRLRDVGVEKMYVSNLPPRGAAEKLSEIRERAGWAG